MDGRIFTIFKFRSMYCDADERLADVLDADPERRREYERYHKLEDDPRVTPIGRILRDYSLDELPQLLNVVLGNMSLVGPRAYLPAELEDMRGLEKVILQTPPGVTGLWQVSGRNNLPFDRRVNLDVHYVQNWSVWLDLYLIARTLPTVVTGEGAN
jgi:lipopolysaccharide/colanic/teichoic acid biosynthesis glycosyltransferase